MHTALFLALTGSAVFARIPPRMAAVALVGYAGLSEVLQAVLPLGRSASVADWLADAIGIGLAVVLMRWRPPSRTRRR